MTLFELIHKETKGERGTILIAATLAGASNAAILASINAAAAGPRSVDVHGFLRFLLLIALYILCARKTSNRITQIIEFALHRIKVRVGDRIVLAELGSLERVGAAEICDRITENATFISDRAGMLAGLLQSLPILVFSGLYIAWLSPPALSLIALLFAAGIAMFLILRKEFVFYMQESAKIRLTFFDRLTDLLSGFKEVKLSGKRGKEVRDEIVKASEALRVVGVKSSNLLSDGMLLGEADLFAVLAAVVFTLRLYTTLDAQTLAHLVAAVMFVWGPIEKVATGILPYSRSNTALAEIEALEAKLSAVTRGIPATREAADPWKGHFSTIVAKGMEYTYAPNPGGESFHVGPVDLTIHAKEVLFIVGGNGSGKSTLLKVLTGLYAPSKGALFVDGSQVDSKNLASYRDMISAIFSDFHLFKKLHGLSSAERPEVKRLLARMHLEGQTRLAGDTFTKLALSTGQRKRLAMVVLLLEDRPICVFDEWAADQDPEFRAYFYEELLPQLKAEGKTVIVVSHDDRYYHHADRIVTMEYGSVQSIIAWEKA